VMTQEPLTADEIACMELWLSGRTQAEVGAELGLSQHQVSYRMRRAAFKAWGAPMHRNGQFSASRRAKYRARWRAARPLSLRQRIAAFFGWHRP
jgi:hypothetical protein